jgi:hypothetical protein
MRWRWGGGSRVDVARPLRKPDLGRILLALGKHGVLPLSLVGYKEPALTYTSTHDQQLSRKFSFKAISLPRSNQWC